MSWSLPSRSRSRTRRRRADPRRPPVPLILVEPGTARMLYANAAAHRLAGGALTLGVPAEELSARLPALSTPPGARCGPTRCRRCAPPAARRSATCRSTGRRPTGMRTVLVSGSTIALAGGRRVTVVTFEDVTDARGVAPALDAAGRRAARDARQRRRRDHRPVARPQADLRQRGRGAPLRHPARAAGSTTSTPSSYLRALRGHRRARARRWTSRGCPGRLALAGLDPEPVIVRSRDRATGEVQLGADQGDRRPRPRRRRAAGDQRDRGHHRAQALRGGAALPGRGVAAALGLARWTTSARWRRWPSWRCRRSPTAASSTSSTRRRSRRPRRSR